MKNEMRKKLNALKLKGGLIGIFCFAFVSAASAQKAVPPSKPTEEVIETDVSASPVTKQGQTLEDKKNADATVIETEIGLDQVKERPALPVLPANLKGKRGATIKPRMPFKKSEDASSPGTDSVPLPAALEAPGGEDVVEVKDKQIVQISASLRRIIEENEKLRKENQELDATLRGLRGQSAMDSNRANTAAKERDQYKKEMDRIVGMNEKFQKDMGELKVQLTEKEKWLDERSRQIDKQMSEVEQAKLNALEEQLPATEQKIQELRNGISDEKQKAKDLEELMAGRPAAPALSVQQAPGATLVQDKEKSLKVIGMVNALSQKNEKIKRDEAQVHYNMGNVFFHQAQYRRAAGEYQQAVSLNPSDSSAHFNLAFVSSEYLNDFRTAMDHFQYYLVLNPGAEDAGMVQEKMLEAEINLRGAIQSSVEKDVRDEKNRIHVR